MHLDFDAQRRRFGELSMRIVVQRLRAATHAVYARRQARQLADSRLANVHIPNSRGSTTRANAVGQLAVTTRADAHGAQYMALL
jgi:hypothetical protein